MRLVAKIVLAVLFVALTIEISAKLWNEPSELDREMRFLVRDDALGWRNRPLADGRFESRARGFSARVSFDDQGLRRNGNELPDRPLEKILVLGDSTTSGMEVGNPQTYPAVLERLYWDHGSRVRVYNAGVRGYGADQSLLQLRRLVGKLRPDLVIYMAGPYGFQQLTMVKQWYRPWSKPAFLLGAGDSLRLVNSPVEPAAEEDFAFVEYAGGTGGVTRRTTKPSGVARLLRHHSFLWESVEAWYFAKYHPAAFAAPDARDWRARTLGAVFRAMKAESPRFAVTGFTMADPKDVPDYDLFREVALGAGVEFLDIRPFFRDGVGYQLPRDGHWNATGHARAGEALFDLLEQRRIRVSLPAGASRRGNPHVGSRSAGNTAGPTAPGNDG